MAEFLSNLEIETICKGLQNKTLPKQDWTHAAHFAAALCLINQWGYEKTKTEMPDIIRQYNLSVGTINSDSEGYHHTITLASLAAAKDVFDTYKDTHELFEIVNILIASEFGQSGWLLSYWSTACLFSVHARQQWVEPDQAPLPFST